MMGRPDDTDDGTGGYASPPCFMHEVDPAYFGLAPEPAPEATAELRADVRRWRRMERQRLIGERLAIEGAVRRRHAEAIAAGLEGALGDLAGRTVSVYWPFRGEPDLRGWMEQVWAQGGRGALPVVVEKGAPLAFRSWRPGEGLVRGVWNIPVPEAGEPAMPDVVIAPVVGFGRSCYRLGYGGGYYDRTLAAMSARPRFLGVGYAQAAIPTIYPQPHDVPMDAVVTERGLVEPVKTSTIGGAR